MFLPNLELTDLNGEAWPFSAPGCPIRLVTVTGLEGADFSFDTSAGVGQPGVTVVARDDEESYVECEVWVGPLPKGDGAVQVLRDFLHGLGRGWSRAGRLMRLESLDTGRFQMVRLAERPASPDWARMFYAGMTDLNFKLMSDESWWRKHPVDRTFTADGFATAAVSNEGDVERGAWPWFRIDGPITNPVLGLMDEQVEIPISLSVGEWLEVQTDPDEWLIVDHTGTDRTWGTQRWHQTAPAETHVIPVNISGSNLSSATRLRVVVPQLFHGAL